MTGYEDDVQRMAEALHEDCTLEWQAWAVLDPTRHITMHHADAHYGKAHDLVRRFVGDPDRGTYRAPTPPDALDVERLARALYRLNAVGYRWEYPLNRDDAAAVAREYAALTPKEPTE